jgi:polysaccharide pyruvyl transferase WcaK-like protein
VKILIIDAYSSAHIGNGVLYQSSVYYLKKVFPNSEINVLAMNKASIEEIASPYVNKHGVCFINDIPVGQNFFKKIKWILGSTAFMSVHGLNALLFRLSPQYLSFNLEKKEAFKMFQEADMIVSITGEQINDSFRKTIPIFAFVHWLAIKFNKKMVYFPQSIGPLNKKWTKWIISKVFNKSFLVVARDKFSYDELVKLKINEHKILFTPDIGIIQPYRDKEASLTKLKDFGVRKNKKILLGLTLSQVHFIEDGIILKDYLKIIEDVICEIFIPEETEILILPANYPLYGSTSNDYYVCETFKEKLSKRYDVSILKKDIYSPYDFKGYLGCLDIFISTRMHASILSTMALTPTITINTQRKLKGYMHNIKMGQYSIDLVELNNDKLKKTIYEVLEKRDEIVYVLSKERNNMLNWLDELGRALMKKDINNKL